MKSTVIIADDFPIALIGLKSLVKRHDISVIADASNGRDALRLAKKLTPTIVLADGIMPHLGGYDVSLSLAISHPKIRTIVMAECTPANIIRSLKCSAKGIISKSASRESYLEAIDTVNQHSFFCENQHAYFKSLSGLDTDPSLTDRERDVLQLISEGHSLDDCTRLMGLKRPIIDAIYAKIKQKL